MPNETTVTVRGEAQAEADPEIAVLAVTVEARDRERARVVDTLAVRTREIRAQITASGDAVQRIESRPVSVQPVFKDGKARGPSGFVGRAGFSVTVGDFAALGEIVTALAGEDMVTLAGPAWQLRPDSPVYRQVRMAAARDSIQRAHDYAEAFGGQISGLVEAADTGLLEGGPRPKVAFASASRRLSGGPGAGNYDEPPEIDLIPAPQTVYAQVEARFTMTRPTLGAASGTAEAGRPR